MQSEVYLSYHGHSPRTIALKTCASNHFDTANNGHVLYFSPHDQPTANGRIKVSVRLEPGSEFNHGLYRKITSRPVHGCLGLMHVAKDTFIAFVTGCSKVGDIRPGESIYRIVSVRFFSLTGNTPDEDMIPAPIDPESDDPPSLMPHPCRELEKVLCNGAFFFSPQFDLTRSVQARAIKLSEKPVAESNQIFDERFLWNYFMVKELLAFRSHLDEQEREELDSRGLLIHLIQGYVGSQSFRTAATQGQISIISRLGSKRAGTRYNTRGVDDNGNVANFVETETIISTTEWCFSYTQIRGSVPVFWEQQGLQLGSHKIQLSRGSDATKPAVRRHFEELLQKYEDVHVLDLMGTKDSGEVTLSQEYKSQVEDLGPLLKHIHMTKFDYHSQVKGGNYDQVNSLLNHVRGDSERYGYFHHDLISDTIVQVQRGVFRTNCLDCLDRTNVIQNNLSKDAVESLLHNVLHQDNRFGSLRLIHSDLWVDNGDLLSKIYTGTGALKSEITRSGKMSFAGMLGDATKSLNRFVINNFQDKDRQEIIDFLLGKMSHQVPVAIYDPIHDSVASEMRARQGEYSQKVEIDVFVGTFNLNGKLPSGEPLERWLCFDEEVPEPDMYVIGFQEIVELTAKQIAVTDENKRRIWEHEVENIINRRGRTRYIQLRSVQLVGAALMIYVKEHNVQYIRNVECVMKKTGLGGMAGNKGAVAVRMDFHETSICLVTAHLASGQDKLQERNEDFQNIDGGIAFARGRNISGHDIILWCGDFNYRVDMDNDQIRALVSQGNYFEIFMRDQLKRSIDYGEAFYGYKEGIIAFPPTYRYDIGTNNYDTSEKYRAPAWTDRILYRGRGILQRSYDRADIRTSDHRPVMSMFVLELVMLDSAAKEKMEEAIYRQNSTRSLVHDTPSAKKVNGLGPRGLLTPPLTEKIGSGYDRALHSMGPKPSSESHQWWNDPLEEGVKRIPSKNKNPFEGDQTISESAKPKPSNGSSSPLHSRPAPPAPVVKKPAVDLLGDLPNENIGAPVLPITGIEKEGKSSVPQGIPGQTRRTSGSNGKSDELPSIANKRVVPPPPASRRAGGVVTALPASPTIHKDSDGSSRRPAPPPPKKNGYISTNKDTDSDDDDDDDDSYRDGGNKALISRIKEDKETGQESGDQEVLLKPSQLKQQQQVPGSTGNAMTKGRSNSGIELIRPSLSSVSSTSSTYSSPPTPSTVAANKPKVLLPGLDQHGSSKPSTVSSPTISSMGSSSAGTSVSSGLGHNSSVLQRTKEFNSKSDATPTSKPTPQPSRTSATTTTAIAPTGTIVKEKGPLDGEDTATISVSELKKSFASSGQGKAEASTPALGPKPSISSGKLSLPLKTMETATATTGSGNSVAAVIPMVKPLSFSTPGTSTPAKKPSTPTGTGFTPAKLPVAEATSSNPGKVKMAGMGSIQAATVLKGANETQRKSEEATVAEDVKPASGSVKQAIASLKANSGSEVPPNRGMEGKDEVEEGEKVDAFAFWKSK
ncbi:inositol polyphosphate 5-phosphatase [Mortierella sp. AD010]|nr:inositol polyphosphate 5-phosphatase [Mortierella sp. AD010]